MRREELIEYRGILEISDQKEYIKESLFFKYDLYQEDIFVGDATTGSRKIDKVIVKPLDYKWDVIDTHSIGVIGKVTFKIMYIEENLGKLCTYTHQCIYDIWIEVEDTIDLLLDKYRMIEIEVYVTDVWIVKVEQGGFRCIFKVLTIIEE